MLSKFFKIFIFLKLSTSFLLAEDLPESSIKAAYIFNFAKYTQWEEEKLSKSEKTQFCILDDFEVYKELLKAESKTINNKKIFVSYLYDEDKTDSCHIIYYPKEHDKHSGEELQKIGSLTIGESSELTMITLYSKDNSLKFKINLDLANKSNITLSSEILKLATEVNK